MIFFISLISHTATVFLVAFYVADIIAALSVKGTRPRYVAVFAMATLIYPVFALKMLDLMISVINHNWIPAAFDLFACWYANRLWNKVKDEDSRWSGRGKKIGEAIKKAFTISSPVASGAGA